MQIMYERHDQYTFAEEVWNAASHGIGVLFSVAATAVLITLAAVYGNVWSVVSCSIFGFTMILLYSASSFYHAIPYPNAKRILKKFDHIAIYFLIAGSYTPFMLVAMRSPTGWTIFGIISPPFST